MNYHPFWGRCQALEKGEQCKSRARWIIPCAVVRDARFNSYDAEKFKEVHLCNKHFDKEDKLRKTNKRLPLIESGFLGAFNEYKFGNLVINTPEVDWKTVKELKVPEFWR